MGNIYNMIDIVAAAREGGKKMKVPLGSRILYGVPMYVSMNPS